MVEESDAGFYSRDIGGQFVLVIDETGGRGSYVWFYYLFAELQRGHRVKILSANHDRGHYEVIFRKQGLDLSRLQSTGDVDLMLLTNTTEGNLQTNDEGEGAAGEAKPQSVFIDDLEALEALARDEQEARVYISRLFARLHQQQEHLQHKALSSLVAMGGGYLLATSLSTSSMAGQEASSAATRIALTLTEFCKYMATTTVSINPLASGYSNQAVGTIEVTSNDAPTKTVVLYDKPPRRSPQDQF